MGYATDARSSRCRLRLRDGLALENRRTVRRGGRGQQRRKRKAFAAHLAGNPSGVRRGGQMRVSVRLGAYLGEKQSERQKRAQNQFAMRVSHWMPIGT